MRWIVQSTDPGCLEERIAGGKGSSLARLVKLGARVPGFAVVSAEAHRAFGDGEPSAEFLAEVRQVVESLNAADGLAVRSSAIGEDAADSSFAGLYHTSLDVRGFDAVVAAIKTCWDSYRNASAVEYREERSSTRDG